MTKDIDIPPAPPERHRVIERVGYGYSTKHLSRSIAMDEAAAHKELERLQEKFPRARLFVQTNQWAANWCNNLRMSEE